MAVHYGLQRTSGTIVKDGKQNKLLNCPRQALTTNIQVNGDSQVDGVSRWTLKNFIILGMATSTEFQNYQNHLIGTLRACSISQGPWDGIRWHFSLSRYWTLGRLGVASRIIPPFLQVWEEEGEDLETLVSPTLPLSSTLPTLVSYVYIIKI